MVIGPKMYFFLLAIVLFVDQSEKDKIKKWLEEERLSLQQSDDIYPSMYYIWPV